jgi:TRAP-type C4-dicarboxylate transport system substrate-binding protein
MARHSLAARFAAATLLAALACAPAAAQAPLRLLSQSQNNSTQFPVENAAIERINADRGLGVAVQRQEYQALGLQLGDALRLVRAGTFDVVSTQIGLASRDDPFVEGIDLIGVSTNMAELRSAVDAFRDVFDRRVQERFGAKVLAIWPFGPQVFFCNQAIRTLEDLRGQKVRSFTPSMSALIEALGATPVSLAFPEVYPALQRGVANCGITSPTSANTGRWPEVTTHLLPLSVSGSVQAHLANLAWWNRLTPPQQAGLTAQFRRMESELWDLATTTNDNALACSTGQPAECTVHTRYTMTLVQVTPADMARVRRAAQETILADWAQRCERVYPTCKQVWNSTVGRARDLVIP